MNKKKRPKKNTRGKLRYSTTTWLSFHQKKQGEYVARSLGMKLAGLMRFLLEEKINEHLLKKRKVEW